MIHWFEHLPIGWMSLVGFAGTYLVTWGIYRVVMALAVGERARAFKAISPGMLPPLGIIFGLLVAVYCVAYFLPLVTMIMKSIEP